MDKLWNWLTNKESDQHDHNNEHDQGEPEHTEEFIQGFQEGWQTGQDFGKLTAYEELLNIYEEKHQDQLYKIDPEMEQSR